LIGFQVLIRSLSLISQLLMSDDREIQDIVNQLQGLQLQQAALLSRLGRLSEGEEQETPPTPPQAAPPPPPQATREFAVGDRVRIRNPRVLQETRGRITRIGLRIAVTTPRGNTTVRAPKNLILEE
jgi:hypothetical protein